MLRLEVKENLILLIASGTWDLSQIKELEKSISYCLKEAEKTFYEEVILEISQINKLDSTGTV